MSTQYIRYPGSGTGQTITLTGEATGSGITTIPVTLSNGAVIGKLLTGYTQGAGTITATDSILTAFQKVAGNDAQKLPLAGGVLSGPLAGTSASFSSTVTGSNLSGTNTGDQTITLTGNVTGSGTGSFATTIAANAVVDSMISGVTTPKITGVATVSNAAAGILGEYVTSTNAGAFTSWGAATNTWGNATTISLTAGDWDVDAGLSVAANGATMSRNQMAISLFSGTTTTDHQIGNNVSDFSLATSNTNSTSFVSAYRINVSATTTVYLKGFIGFTVATPQIAYRISARRVR